MNSRLAYRPFFIKLFHWEYWSFSAVYVPIYIVWIGLCLRARSFFFFAASNPAIRNGGFLNESKKDIIPLIPAGVHPRTLFFSVPADPCSVMQQLEEAGFCFPLIGKPDIGARGRGVKKLVDADDVKAYVKTAAMDFHVQEFIAYPHEAGIFYYRYPGEARGRLSGIVRKEFLTVKGDGSSTIGQLLQQDKRAILQYAVLEKTLGTGLHDVPVLGEERVLVPYGNHARGAKFLDDSHRIDEALTIAIDRVCQEIPDFYFGRLDIRYCDWDRLRQGQDFVVIEVNGAGSEPTHIYDPRHSIFFAWKEIIRHWIILWRISRRNHRRGVPYLSMREGIGMFREDKVWSEKLKVMGERELKVREEGELKVAGERKLKVIEGGRLKERGVGELLLRIFATGLFISFLGTLPLGTLNVLAAQMAVDEGVSPALWFSMGALLMEMVYVRLSLVAMDWFRRKKKWVRAMEGLTVIIILLLAFGSFRAAARPGQSSGVIIGSISTAPLARLLTGILLSAINPLQIPFWFGWSTLLFQKKVLLPRNDHYNVYIAGIGLGTFAGNAVFIFGGRLFVKTLAMHQSLVNGVVGGIFLVTALMLFSKMVRRGGRESRDTFRR